MIVEWVCETGFATCKYHGEFEVDDNATEEEISQAVMDEALNFIEIGWHIKDGEQNAKT